MSSTTLITPTGSPSFYCSYTDAEWLEMLHSGDAAASVQYLTEHPTTPLAALAVETLIQSAASGEATTAESVSKLFVPHIKGSIWASIWLSYLGMLKQKKISMKVIHTALEAAGKDPSAYLLWKRCIELARDIPESAGGGTNTERALYQRAVVLPLFAVEALLGEYRSFEEAATGSKNVQLPKELLEKYEEAVQVSQLLRTSYSKAGATTWVVPRSLQDPSKEPHLAEEQQLALQQWKEATLHILSEADATSTTAATATSETSSDSSSSTTRLVWSVALEWHFKKIVSLFPFVDSVWADYAVAASSHGFLPIGNSSTTGGGGGGLGADAAISVVKQGLAKCKDSALLHLLLLELNQTNATISADSVAVTVEDCEAVAKEVGALAGMVAFTKLDPAVVKANPKRFRQLGKDAVKKGCTDWMVYKTWAALETYTIQEVKLVQEILTRASSKFPTPGILGTQLLLASQSHSEEQLDTQQALKLHEGLVAEVSVGQKSVGGDAIVAPLVVGCTPLATTSTGSGRYVPSAGLRKMAWQRFCRFEKVFRGTHTNTVQERSVEELDPTRVLVPTTSHLVLEKIQQYSVGLLHPVPDPQLELYQTLSLLGPAKVRKELEERGDFESPLKLQGLSIDVTCPAVRHCAIRPCLPSSSTSRAAAVGGLIPPPPQLGSTVGGWTVFIMPVNTNPAKPNDDLQSSSIPCGPRTMKGNLQRKLVLDIAGRRLQKKIETEQRAAAQKEEDRKQATRGLPAQLASFLEHLPVITEITKHEGQGFAASSAKFSAGRIVGKFHHLWLLQELQSRPKDPLVPPCR